MNKYYLNENQISKSEGEGTITFSDISTWDAFLNDANAFIIAGQMQKPKTYANLSFYDNIIYGNFLLSQKEAKLKFNIYFFFRNDVLNIFCPKNVQNELIEKLNLELKKHSMNFMNTIDLILLIAHMSLDDLSAATMPTQGAIDNLENGLINDKQHEKFNQRLLRLRKQISRLRKNAKALNSCLDILLYQDFITINKSYGTLLQHETSRLENDIKEMNEHSIQVKELYQNLLDVRLNNTMNLFTVISAIFLPLTLITSWYGMNFMIPEFGWGLGYLIPIVLCIVCLSVILYIIRRFKFLKRNR